MEHCCNEENTHWWPTLMSENPKTLNSLTFQLADLRLTVRPLVVTVHFILMKKSLSVLSSLPFLPKALPRAHWWDTVSRTCSPPPLFFLMVARILRVLTSCLQAEVFSDFLVVTRMGEVKDALSSEIHLEDGNKI